MEVNQMTGRLRWSCQLATWTILLTGVARLATAEVPSTFTTPRQAMLQGEEKQQAVPQPDSQWPAVSQCDDCACLDKSCYECPCPVWDVSAGALFLSRSNPDNKMLYQDNTSGLYGSDFDLGWETGFQIELARRNINCGDDIVARLFIVDGWSADAVANFPGNLESNTAPIVGIAGPREFASHLTSELTSFELDYYCQSAWSPAVKWLVGIRTLELDENMGTGLVFPGGGLPTVCHTVAVQNRLYGVQIGGELKLLNTSRLSLKGVLTTGLYGNSARHTSALWEDTAAADYVVDRHSVLSFVGETGIAGQYQLTDSLALRGLPCVVGHGSRSGNRASAGVELQFGDRDRCRRQRLLSWCVCRFGLVILRYPAQHRRCRVRTSGDRQDLSYPWDRLPACRSSRKMTGWKPIPRVIFICQSPKCR